VRIAGSLQAFDRLPGRHAHDGLVLPHRFAYDPDSAISRRSLAVRTQGASTFMNSRVLASLVLAFATAILGQNSVQAGFELAPIISDHMVIQRSKPIVLWGWDAPGQQVNVTLDGSNARATADAQGRWQVTLPAMPAGGPYEIVISGSVTVTVSTAEMRPLSLSYDYDGEQVQVSVLGIKPLETPLKAFAKDTYAGYEFIDFR